MKTVLSVDDDPSFRAFVRAALTQAGYEVIEGESGEDALRLMRERRPDLLLLDFEIGYPDGGEVRRTLRESPFLSRIPVVFLTGQYYPRLAEGETVLFKPVSHADLVSVIEDRIGR